MRHFVADDECRHLCRASTSMENQIGNSVWIQCFPTMRRRYQVEPGVGQFDEGGEQYVRVKCDNCQ